MNLDVSEESCRFDFLVQGIAGVLVGKGRSINKSIEEIAEHLDVLLRHVVIRDINQFLKVLFENLIATIDQEDHQTVLILRYQVHLVLRISRLMYHSFL